MIFSRGVVGRALGETLSDRRAKLTDRRRETLARQRAVADAMPQLEQLVGLGEQSGADLLRCASAVGDLLEVPDQMRPTQLPPLKRPPTVARPPIRDQVARKLAQQLSGGCLAAAQVDLEDCYPVCDHDPQP